MKVAFCDFNGFAKAGDPALVHELMAVVEQTPLFVKESDQAQKQGALIFDPVGTNNYIETRLKKLRWSSKVPIPDAWQALGIDVDFGKRGHLVEVQFSNYPFLLNNVIRTNVLFNGRTNLEGMGSIESAMVITKGKILPASNSTLYYEQAKKQIEFLITGKTINVPLRLIGLTTTKDDIENAVITHYHAARYSRTVVDRDDVVLRVGEPGSDPLEREPLIKLPNR